MVAGSRLAVAISQGSAAILTVGLLFALVPVLGAEGAAITTTVAYGVSSAVLLAFLALTTGVAQSSDALANAGRSVTDSLGDLQ